MYNHALILHPIEPLSAIDVNHAEVSFRNLGIIVDRLPPINENWYALSATLLEYITFLGCSPTINFAASNHAVNFCRLHLPPTLAAPVWRAAHHAAAPRCPHCRALASNWRAAVTNWEADPINNRQVCEQCGNSTPLHQWRLRETSGFGQSFIEFWGIHSGEAVPGEELLTILSKLNNSSWQWFYWSN